MLLVEKWIRTSTGQRLVIDSKEYVQNAVIRNAKSLHRQPDNKCLASTKVDNGKVDETYGKHAHEPQKIYHNTYGRKNLRASQRKYFRFTYQSENKTKIKEEEKEQQEPTSISSVTSECQLEPSLSDTAV